MLRTAKVDPRRPAGVWTGGGSGGFFNPDQQRLEDVGNSIKSADFFILNIGLVVGF